MPCDCQPLLVSNSCMHQGGDPRSDVCHRFKIKLGRACDAFTERQRSPVLWNEDCNSLERQDFKWIRPDIVVGSKSVGVRKTWSTMDKREEGKWGTLLICRQEQPPTHLHSVCTRPAHFPYARQQYV